MTVKQRVKKIVSLIRHKPIIGQILILLHIPLAGSAFAQDPVDFRDHVAVGGVLTFDEVYLRNRGGQALDFYISLEGNPWRLYRIPADKAALIDGTSGVIAISTARNDDDEAVEIPPKLDPSSVTTSRVGADGLYYYAPFKGSERIELCWSDLKNRWVAQQPHERVCGL